jgi:hypothetical protein
MADVATRAGMSKLTVSRVINDAAGASPEMSVKVGTGEQTPRPPTEGLARYYELLEQTHGFQRRWARTDYAFDSPQQATERLRFFFGEELAGRVLDEQLTIVPECTGFWFRQG